MDPKLYGELADWWPLMSPVADYAEEAQQYAHLLLTACQPIRVLELGSGGGNNAFYLKHQFSLTLVDRSLAMLAVSRQVNPECEHHQGDMRSVRLSQQYDAVFIHDALAYLISPSELVETLETALLHCRAGGVVLLAPDFFAETFRPATSCGGSDANGRSLRYLEWVYDPDSSDTTYLCEFAFLLRKGNEATRVIHDRHVLGLFAREQWLAAARDAGLNPEIVRASHSHPEPGESELLLCRREGTR
jgi:SAM-dependent methyltransferase